MSQYLITSAILTFFSYFEISFESLMMIDTSQTLQRSFGLTNRGKFNRNETKSCRPNLKKKKKTVTILPLRRSYDISKTTILD